MRGLIQIHTEHFTCISNNSKILLTSGNYIKNKNSVQGPCLSCFVSKLYKDKDSKNHASLIISKDILFHILPVRLEMVEIKPQTEK